MANKKLWSGILAMALVLGMTVVGCDNGSTDNNGGKDALDGTTWVASGAIITETLTFNRPNFTWVEGNWTITGTYTVSGNKVTMTFDGSGTKDTAILSGNTLLFQGTTFTKSSDNGNNPGTGGTFTLTGIPSQYNGKYAAFEAGNDSIGILGMQSISIITQTYTASPISNGSVSIPTWIFNESTNSVSRYSGNDTVGVDVNIVNDATSTSNNKAQVLTGRIFTSVTFSNGSATRAWSAGTEK